MKRKLFERLANLVFPPKCAVCGEVTDDKKPLCPECLEKYTAEARETCAFCGRSAEMCLCDDLPRLICLTFYKGYYGSGSRVTEKLVFALKSRKNQRLAEFFAMDLAYKIIKAIRGADGNKGDYVLTYLPRGQKNYKKYGFDHAELLCDNVAKFTEIWQSELFVRHGGGEQKKMDREGRTENVGSTLVLADKVNVRGRRVILIDDIVTTGATMKHGAELLYSAGATEVICAVIARTARKRGDRR